VTDGNSSAPTTLEAFLRQMHQFSEKQRIMMITYGAGALWAGNIFEMA
jgi:hypothetical protein